MSEKRKEERAESRDSPRETDRKGRKRARKQEQKRVRGHGAMKQEYKENPFSDYFQFHLLFSNLFKLHLTYPSTIFVTFTKAHVFDRAMEVLRAVLAIIEFLNRSIMQSLYFSALWVPILILVVLSGIHS
jgi:hypothetical protein